MSNIAVICGRQEATRLAEALRPFSPSEVGTLPWLQQRLSIFKLNQQARQSSMFQQENYASVAVSDADKFQVVVHELVCISLWREKVWEDVKGGVAAEYWEDPQNDYTTPYLVLEYEKLLVGLLEISLFVKDCALNLGAAGLDLVKYLYKSLVWLNSCDPFDVKTTPQSPTDIEAESSTEKLTRMLTTDAFHSAISCIPMAFYVAEVIDEPEMISTANQVYSVQDLPVVLMTLLDTRPWERRSRKRGKVLSESWDASKTKFVPKAKTTGASTMGLSMWEGNLWFSLHALLLSKTASKKYQLTSSRTDAITRMQRHMSDVLMDQIPPLQDLNRAATTAVMQANASAKSSGTTVGLQDVHNPEGKSRGAIIMEITSDMMEEITMDTEWGEVRANALSKALSNDNAMRKLRLQLAYGQDLESIVDTPECGNCGKPAANKCSRCKMVWYCSRECLVADFKNHKTICKQVAKAQAEMDEKK